MKLYKEHSISLIVRTFLKFELRSNNSEIYISNRIVPKHIAEESNYYKSPGLDFEYSHFIHKKYY